MNAALAQVAFIPASDYDQDTTIAVNIADGGENSAVPVTGTITLDVTPVQDAPTASDRTVVTPEDINYAFRLMDFGFSDVDGESLAQIQPHPHRIIARCTTARLTVSTTTP